MRSAVLVALVAAGVLAAGCASSRGNRSIVARATPSPVQAAPSVADIERAVLRSAPAARVSARSYAVYAPPPPPPPSMTNVRSYARAPVREATPVRRDFAPVRRAPAPVYRAATVSRVAPAAREVPAARKPVRGTPSGGGLAGLLAPCSGGT